MSKPFKMKGSPFQRNFGIGRAESPDAITPAKGLMEGLGKIDLKGAAQAALSQLPGGKIASSEETTGYEKDKEGNLKLDKDGNPIPIKTESKSESKPYTIKDMFSNVKDFLNPKKESDYDDTVIKNRKQAENLGYKVDDPITMKGSPAKHPWPGADPSKSHGHEASDIYKENKEKQKEKEKKKKEKKDKKNKKK
tara:strand:+ start:1394 stop:1975 length:582 start_codon:yes stop_codon:yes gene_type:complete